MGGQRHVEVGAGREQPVGIGSIGRQHAGLTRGGVVDSAQAVLGTPLELGNGRVGVPQGKVCQTDGPSRLRGAEIGEPAVVHLSAGGDILALLGRNPPEPVCDVERQRLTVQAVVEDHCAGDSLVVHVAEVDVSVVVTSSL